MLWKRTKRDMTMPLMIGVMPRGNKHNAKKIYVPRSSIAGSRRVAPVNDLANPLDQAPVRLMDFEADNPGIV
jgi:hypothetical protein